MMSEQWVLAHMKAHFALTDAAASPGLYILFCQQLPSRSASFAALRPLRAQRHIIVSMQQIRACKCIKSRRAMGIDVSEPENDRRQPASWECRRLEQGKQSMWRQDMMRVISEAVCSGRVTNPKAGELPQEDQDWPLTTSSSVLCMKWNLRSTRALSSASLARINCIRKCC